MKLLLLTDTPPSSGTELGVLLGDLCRMIAPGGVVCFAARERDSALSLYPDLDWMPLALTEKPNERGLISNRRPISARLATVVLEAGRRTAYTGGLIDMAASFGRAHGVDAVWAVLQGQTMVRMAKPVAQRLNARLYTQVREPLNWRMMSTHIDKINRRLDRGAFAGAVRSSQACATASSGMASYFHERYGVACTTVMPSLPADMARPPRTALDRREHLTIAVTGEFFEHAEWTQFLTVLSSIGWVIGSRPVRFRAYGAYSPVGNVPSDIVDYRGDLPEAEMLLDLAEGADLLYVPFPFDLRLEELARQTLPRRFAALLASGVPMLFHGPDYSAAHEYLTGSKAAILCTEPTKDAIFHALLRSVVDDNVYETASAGAWNVFQRHFSRSVLQDSFQAFLGTDPATLGAGRSIASPISARLAQYARPPLHQKAETEGVRRQHQAQKQQATAGHARNTLAGHSFGSDDQEYQLYVLRSDLQHLQRQASEEMEGPRHTLEVTRAELSDLRTELSAARAELTIERDAAISRAEILEVALNASREEALEYVREMARLRATINALQGAHLTAYTFSAELAQAMRHGESMQHEIERLRDALRDEQAHVARLDGNLIQASLDLAALDSESEDLRLAKRAAESALESALAALLSDRDGLAQAGRRNDEQVQELARLAEAMAAMRGDAETAAAVGDYRQVHLAKTLEMLHNAITDFSAQAPKNLTDAELRTAGRLSVIATNVEDMKRSLVHRAIGNGSSDLGRATMYLDLLETAICGELFHDRNMAPWGGAEYDADRRLLGRDWPARAHSMIGKARLRNIRVLAEDVLAAKVPGDFLEAGVWRGGACIYMRGILAVHGDRDRKVWVADSFAGLPRPNPELYPADSGDEHHTVDELAVSLEEVSANFAAYGLLDERVRFLPGWFKDTLPGAPVERLAILRLDGDMYSSTMETLEALYSKVSPGGYVIVDDYVLPGCRAAVDDYRERNGVTDALIDVDGAAVYWRKSSGRQRRKSAPEIRAAAE